MRVAIARDDGATTLRPLPLDRGGWLEAILDRAWSRQPRHRLDRLS